MIVRMKGIKKVRAKGHTYIYHRKTMKRLPDQEGTPEFMRAFLALEQKLELASGPGTLGALIEKYRRSYEFTEAIAKSTRSLYQDTFDYLKPIAGMPLNRIDSAFLYQVRDKAVAKKKRHFANMTITVLRLLFTWAMKRDYTERNPGPHRGSVQKAEELQNYQPPVADRRSRCRAGRSPASIARANRHSRVCGAAHV
jgi:hypothetical protein